MMLRFAQVSDAAQMLAVYAPYIEQTVYTFEYEPPTEAEFAERIRTITRQFPWLVWEQDGRILGYAYGSAPFERAAYRWCAEVSIYLHPHAQRQGIGRRLYTALERLLFLQGYRVLYALVTRENEASLMFHREMGYTAIAELPACGVKFGRWIGVVYLEKRACDGGIPDREPIPWTKFAQNREGQASVLDTLTLP